MSVRRVKTKDGKLGPWTIDIEMELPNGRKVRTRKVSPVQSRRGAQEFERQLRESLLSGEHAKQETHLRTFKEFGQEFMQDYVSATNKASELVAKESILRLHLTPAFGSHLLKEIDEAAINRFVKAQLEKQLSPKTINNQLILLRTILGCALENEQIAKLPRIRKLKVLAQRVEFLTDEEKFRLIETATEESEWRAAVLVALNCGLRLGELIGLKWEDIDLIGKNLWVQRSDWQGHVDIPKSGKSRTIPLNQEVIEGLRRIRSLKGEWVFSRPDGTRRNKDEFASALERIRKRAGLRGFGWHMLRHTFASHLACKNIPMHVIKDLLGHSSLTMTMRYAHLGEDDSRRAVECLNSASADSRQHSGRNKNAAVPLGN